MEFTAHLRSAHLEDLGWNSFFESYFTEFRQTGLLPFRVVEEFKGFYRVRSARSEYLRKSPASCNIWPPAGKTFPPSETGSQSWRVRKMGGRALSTSYHAGPSSPLR